MGTFTEENALLAKVNLYFWYPSPQIWLSPCFWICSACGARLVAAIRAALVKGRSSEDEVYAAADESAQELKEKIRQLHQNHKEAASEDRTGTSPARVMYSSYSFQPFSLSPYILYKANSFDCVYNDPLIDIPCRCPQSQRHMQSIMPQLIEAGTPWRCWWHF